MAANIREKNRPWENTCALRSSYILSRCGSIIPAMPGQTVKGGDKRNYFFRVKDVIAFLKIRWGNPEVVACPPTGGGPLSGRKGIILFEDEGWNNARGHATLFNGVICHDHCYFNAPSVTYRTPKANFWSLQ